MSLMQRMTASLQRDLGWNAGAKDKLVTSMISRHLYMEQQIA